MGYYLRYIHTKIFTMNEEELQAMQQALLDMQDEF